MINLIWAMTEDRLIGNKNLIPWHVKEDLLYYKEKTKGQTVLMGENTYDSLKSYYKTKPLPYGKIYVASLSDREFNDGIKVTDVVSFLENIDEDIFVVGGASIYKLALSKADRLYISIIKGKYEGDTYFPEFDLSLFNLISKNETDKVIYYIYERESKKC